MKNPPTNLMLSIHFDGQRMQTERFSVVVKPDNPPHKQMAITTFPDKDVREAFTQRKKVHALIIHPLWPYRPGMIEMDVESMVVKNNKIMCLVGRHFDIQNIDEFDNPPMLYDTTPWKK